MSWRSIDESDPTVVLRGIPALAARPRRLALTPGLLAAALHRLISWSGALTVHLVVAALLVSVWIESRRSEDALVSVSLQRGNAGEEGKVPDAPKAPEAPKEEPKPEPPAPEPPKVEPTPEPPKPDPVPEKPKEEPTPAPPAPADTTPSPNPVAGAPAESPKPATIGGGASSTGRPAPSGGGGDHDVEKDPAAALQQRRAGELDQLRKGAEKDIVVVTGAYDHVENVLDRLRIPHTIVDPERLPNVDLGEAKLLLINCHVNYAAYLFGDVDTAGLEKNIVALAAQEDQLRKRKASTKDARSLGRIEIELLRTTSSLSASRQRLEGIRMGQRMLSNVRTFVDRGGYVFTSDWGLSLIEKAFPGYVKNGGNVGPRTVTLRPRASESTHPFLDGVFYDLVKGGTTSLKKFRWAIDSSSYLIRVERTAEVDVLVESPELSKHSAVAVTFRPEIKPTVVFAGPAGSKPPAAKPEPGKGRVLHILSHFDKQATQQGDYALQSMLLNFMLERVAGSR